MYSTSENVMITPYKNTYRFLRQNGPDRLLPKSFSDSCEVPIGSLVSGVSEIQKKNAQCQLCTAV